MHELYEHADSRAVTVEEAADHFISGSGKETFVLARTLEAAGWSTTGGRLLRPYLVKGVHGAWGAKGVGGVKERKSDEIKLGIHEAVEFRTFQLQNLTGLDRTLRSAFLLGAALHAYQTEARGESVTTEGDPVIREQLSAIWEKFSHESQKIFSAYNLADPKNAWHAPSYADSADMRAENPFKHLGDTIDEARQHPDSQGAEFVAEIRRLIITTRKQVADIIYKKNFSASEEAL